MWDRAAEMKTALLGLRIRYGAELGYEARIASFGAVNPAAH